MKTATERRKRRSTTPNRPNQRQKLAAETAALMEATIHYIDCKDFRTIPPKELLADDDIKAPANSRSAAPADMPPYLASLYEFPLLDPQQEYRIFRKMHYLRYQAARLQKRLSLKALNRERVRQIQTLLQQADDVRNRIVQCNLRLVVSIAKTMVDSANSLDDLISDGNFPLIRAVELFDYTRGLRFSTYATWAVRNGLYRISNRNRKLQKKFRAEEHEWILETPSVRNGNKATGTRLEPDQLDQLVSQLDRRSQTIIRDRFGLGDRPRPARFRELAAKLKLSSERVRQLLERALNQLRALESGTEI